MKKSLPNLKATISLGGTLLCFLLMSSFQKKEVQKFVVQTNFVKNLYVIDQANENTYPVPEYKKASGGYLITCSDPSNTFLQARNHTHTKLILLWLNKNQTSDWIEIKEGQKVRLSDCFAAIQSPTVWKKTQNIYHRITSFFTQSRIGLVHQGRSAELKVSQYQFQFNTLDSLHLFDPSEMKLEWTTNGATNQISLEEIGSSQILWQQEDYLKEEWSTESLPIEVQGKLTKGRYYRFRCNVTYPDQETSYHERTFYIMDDEEAKTLQEFIDQ